MYYFLHIPKTAGTSFTNFLDSYFPPERIYGPKLWCQLLEDPRHIDWSKYDLIRGHFGYGMHRYLPKDTSIVTLLRNPVERTISLHHHVMSDTNVVHVLGDRIIKEIGGGDLGKMLQDTEFKEYISNVQTKHLGFDIDLAKDLSLLNREKLAAFAFNRVFNDYIPHVNTEELLSDAIDHTMSFSFFGIQEFYVQSILLFCYTFKKKPYLQKDRYMVFPNRPPKEIIPHEVIQEIEEINRLDTRLYETMREEFVKRYTNAVLALSNEFSITPPPFEDTRSIVNLLALKQSKD